MVTVSAPDERVAALLTAGQVPRVALRASVLLRQGGAVAVPLVSAQRKSSMGYIARHELQAVIPDLSKVEARDLAQRRAWDALDLTGGHSLRVSVEITAGRESVRAPQGVYWVAKAPRGAGGSWLITGKSHEELVRQANLLADIKAEGSALEFLSRRIQAACPGARLEWDDAEIEDVRLTATLLRSDDGGASNLLKATQQDSAWAAVRAVERACGWRVGCDLEGRWRVTLPRAVSGTPDWVIARGETLTSFEGSLSLDEVCNIAVVTSTDGKYTGVAVDDRPGSPTYPGPEVVAAAPFAATRGVNAQPGFWPVFAHRVVIDGIGSEAQATQAARAELSGRRSSVKAGSTWQPWADVEDRVLIRSGVETPRLAVLTDVTVDLGSASGPMDLEVRE